MSKVTEDEIKAFIDKNYKSMVKRHLGIEGPLQVESEYSLPNGQKVDKVIIGANNKVIAIIECKGEEDTNAFVDGIGQAVQAKYQIQLNENEEFVSDAKSFLAVPIEVSTKLPLEKFDYSNIQLILIDIKNNQTIAYKPGLYNAEDSENWVTINPYYFRDCSLEGIFFYLKLILKNCGTIEKLTLSEMEKKIKEIRDKKSIDFFGDIRNNHIVPSVLGFYDPSTKMLSIKGYDFAKKDFIQFCKDVVLFELGEYSRAVFISINELSKKKSLDKGNYFEASTQEISDKIKELYLGKKVTYLFDPDGQNRNLLTMIRMLESIGSVERSKGNKIKINYVPLIGMPFLMEKFGKYNKSGLDKWFNLFEMSL